MPDMKRNFTSGKMNKDLDERLVPQGEYRDAMNIQVSTSEGSDVGTVQNVLGNTLGCTYANPNDNPIPSGSSTVGSISDEKNDSLYWLVAGPIGGSLHSSGDYSIKKDMIMRTNNNLSVSPSACEPVFVDIYSYIVDNTDSAIATNLLSSPGIIDFAYPGMTATGFSNNGSLMFTQPVIGVGSLSAIQGVGYDLEIDPPDVTTVLPPTNISPQLSFVDCGADHFTGNQPYNTGDPGYYLPSGFYVPSSVLANQVQVQGGQNYLQIFDPLGNPIVNQNNSSYLQYTVNNDPYGSQNPLILLSPADTTAFQSAFSSGTYASQNGTAYASCGAGIGAGVIDMTGWTFSIQNLTPNYGNQITITNPTWLSEIDTALADGLTISFDPSPSWPGVEACIDPNSAGSGVYDVVDCNDLTTPAYPVSSNPVNLNFSSELFVDAAILSEDVDLSNVSTIEFTLPRVLNFQSSNLIIGLNIIDDMLFWTDNNTEPKKINITRSIAGTEPAGETHTAIVNSFTGLSLLNYNRITEEHITVIRNTPKKALNIQLNTSRDPNLNYSGVVYTAIDPSLSGGVNASSIIPGSSNPTVVWDFSTLQVGDRIRIEVETDINASADFSLQWKDNDILLLKEYDVYGNAPAVPLSDHRIRCRIDGDWTYTSFTSDSTLQTTTYGSEWTSSVQGTAQVEVEILGLNGTPPQADFANGQTSLNYIIDLEDKKEVIFEDKFPRFSYRYKYEDGEYSTYAPWSEVAFVPGNFDYEPKKGFNTGMLNNLTSANLKGFAPTQGQQPFGQDVVEVDILYKDDKSPNVYVVETISPIDILPAGATQNPWYADEYIIKSETIKNLLPSNQLLRSWDNVPKKALAQDVTGNRVVYANYEENYDLTSNNENYKPDFKNYLTLWNAGSLGASNKSIKSLRDYKLGVVFTDKYGRETPILISESGGFKVEKKDSINYNRLVAGLKGSPPVNMTYFKFFIKETSTEYYNLAMDRWYSAEDGNIWLAFPSSDRNKVDIDTSLYFKKGNDEAINNTTKYKILALENEAPEFIKTRRVRIGTITHDTSTQPTSQVFGSTGDDLDNAPMVGGVSFMLDYTNGSFGGSSLSHMEDIREDLYIQFISSNDYSEQYKISEITADRKDSAGADQQPTKYYITLDTNLKNDIDFIFDSAISPTKISNGVKIQFTKAIVENKPKYDGRFFAKIENDGKIKLQITDDTVGVNYIETASQPVYLLENDDLLITRSSQARVNGIGVNWITDNNNNYPSFPSTGFGGPNDNNPNGINWKYYYARQSYFGLLDENFATNTINPTTLGTSEQLTMRVDPQDQGDEFGVWFIDRSTKKYTTSASVNTLIWGNSDNMDSFFPQCNLLGAAGGCPNPITGTGPHLATSKTGPGINHYSTANESSVRLGFGGIKKLRSTDSDVLLKRETAFISSTNNMTAWWHIGDNPPHQLDNFFSIGEGDDGYPYGDNATNNFVEKINSGFSFKWEHDPTETVYTITGQFHNEHNIRFGRHDDGDQLHVKTMIEAASSYHKTWNFNVTPSMANWDPAGPIGVPMTAGLQLGDKVHTKTNPATSSASAYIGLNNVSNIKVGMTVFSSGGTVPTGTTVTSVITTGAQSPGITMSNNCTFSSTNTNIDIGFTIRLVSTSLYLLDAAAVDPKENYIVVDSVQSECSYGNTGKPIYSLHEGMMLDSYNIDTAPTGTGNNPVIIESISEYDAAAGGHIIRLTGYHEPLNYNGADFTTAFAANERLLFKQVPMNGASNFTVKNTETCKPNWTNIGETDGSGGIGAVGYRMIMVEPVEEYSDGGNLPPNPFIWETEPKEDTDLDIYYEISENNAISLNPDTIVNAIPIGSQIENESGDGLTSWSGVYVSNNTSSTGDIIQVSQLVWIGPGVLNIPGTSNVIQPFEVGSKLKITKPNGIIFEVQVTEVISDPTNPNATRRFRINNSLYNSDYFLNWHNCYSFGNGVESNRIRDAFNLPFIANGVKVSTTLNEQYKQDRKKYGLIYSGIYNSTSGINNLNQFIQAEKITKDVNPTYGSIQKLHSRNSDLVALCEDKILKILANKDAVFNADGNTQLTATQNVLGQTIPFSGEYGISKNPESFASESYRAYFTDKVRGAILRLSKDGLTPISEFGMKDWFRDNLKLSNKLIGSYDDKKDQYNITLDNSVDNQPKTVTFKENVKGWVSFKSFIPENANSCANEYYTFKEGNLWRHHDDVVNVNYNTFYNTQGHSSINVILNDAPGSVKTFHTLNYEGSQSKIDQLLSYDTWDITSWNGTFTNGVANYTLPSSSTPISDGNYYNLNLSLGWYVDDIHTDLEQGAVPEFIEKEGKWFNYIIGKSFDPNIFASSSNLSGFDSSDSAFQGVGNLLELGQAQIYGCTDSSAVNFNAGATLDDNSCIAAIYGCMDIFADNYMSAANINETSDINNANPCLYYGCINDLYINYDSNANYDPLSNDGSCTDLINEGCNIMDDMTPIGDGFNYPLYTNADNTFNVTCPDNDNDGVPDCCTLTILGCTDPSAMNYNPLANTDYASGSSAPGACQYGGCTDSNAFNYDSNATVDDGSCSSPNFGCTDPLATNYDPTVNINSVLTCDQNDPNPGGEDGSCVYTGCTNPLAYEFLGEILPTNINGLDMTDASFVNCSGGALGSYPTAIDASNYDTLNYLNQQLVTDNGSCSCNDANNNPSFGCTDATQSNYDPTAVCDDGSCIPVLFGCTDPTASNYNINATNDDNSCIFLGCTDSLADNYDATATVDDGTCTYPISGCMDSTDCNYDPTATVNDQSLCIGALSGCTDATACNYDSSVCTDDGSCVHCADDTLYPRYLVNQSTNPQSIFEGASLGVTNFDADTDGDGIADISCGNNLGCTYCNIGLPTLTSTTINTGASSASAQLQWTLPTATSPQAPNADITAMNAMVTCVGNPNAYGNCSGGGCCDTSGVGWGGDIADLVFLGYGGSGNGWGTQTVQPGSTFTGGFGNLPLGANIQVSVSGQCGTGIHSSSWVAIQVPSIVNGCTDSTALNYDSNATVDDGSCYYCDCSSGAGNCTYGCTDPTATNYDPNASCDDGSCITPLVGCTDNTMFNFDPNANTACVDSNNIANGTGGGCCTPVISGCMECGTYWESQNPGQYCDGVGPATTIGGFNFNPNANTPVTNCQPVIVGCTDVNANNWNNNNPVLGPYYDVNVPCDGSSFNSPACVVDSNNTMQTGPNCCCNYCIWGCTDPAANNYDATATCDDGVTCVFPSVGCTDPFADNYSSQAVVDDGSCTYTNANFGCMDSNANNYDSNATAPCNSDPANQTLPGQNECCTYNPIAGCQDQLATNYNSTVMTNCTGLGYQTANGCCTYPVQG